MHLFFGIVLWLLLLVSLCSAAVTLRSWDEAYALAKEFIADLEFHEKVAITTGRSIPEI
jgi:hypothetical protein